MIDNIEGLKEFKINAIKLKEEYRVFMHSSFLNIKENVDMKRHWKRKIYNMKTTDFYKDMMWRYLNNDLNYEEFIEVIEGREKWKIMEKDLKII